MDPNSDLFSSQMEDERNSINNKIQAGNGDKYYNSAVGGDPVVDAPGPDPSHGGLEAGYGNHELGG